MGTLGRIFASFVLAIMMMASPLFTATTVKAQGYGCGYNQFGHWVCGQTAPTCGQNPWQQGCGGGGWNGGWQQSPQWGGGWQPQPQWNQPSWGGGWQPQPRWQQPPQWGGGRCNTFYNDGSCADRPNAIPRLF